MAERDGLVAASPGAWVLTLGPTSEPALTGAGRAEAVPVKEAGLLALLLRGDVRGPGEMVAALWDDESDDPSARYRQTVSRLRRRLRAATGDPALDVEDADGALVLRTSVPVLAAVHLPTLTNLGHKSRRVARS